MEEPLLNGCHSAQASEERKPSSSSSTLPQELVDQIIDHLHSDVPSLRSCSTVCRAWLPSSRLHLFSKVQLDIPERHSDLNADPGICHRPGACQRLYRLLLENPTIKSQIHDLALVFTMPLGRIAVTDDDEDYRSLWVDEKILPLLLRLLTHLKRFEIASRQGNTSWHTLSSLLLDAFEELFQRLDYIRIKAWDFPQMESFDKLLHHCPNLKGLTLWKSRIGPADSYDRSPEEYDDGDEKDSEIALDSPSPDLDIIHKHSAILLEFLTFDYVECAYLGDWLLNRPHLVHLNGIHELRIAHSNDKSVQRLLRAVGGSLQRFHFKPGPIGLQRLDLSHNTSLRCVWLTLEEDSGMLPWISALLSTAPNLDGLERVVLELYTDPKRLEIEDWRTLHKVCSEAPRATINIGIFASPNSVEFLQIQEEMSTVVSESESTPRVRVYQLGTKRQGSICAGMIPVIEKFEDDFGRRMSGSHGHGHF